MNLTEKPVRDSPYLSGTSRYIPNLCGECPRRIPEYDGKAGSYCQTHVSIVEKDDHILNVYTVVELDTENAYVRHQESCKHLEVTSPRYVLYADTYGGKLEREKKMADTAKGEEAKMLKDQRERLPTFQANIQKIIDADGIDKVVELLKVTKPTIKKWVQGKESGGTEPSSSDYNAYEKKINAYMEKLNKRTETAVVAVVPAEVAVTEAKVEDSEMSELIDKNSLRNEVTFYKMSAENLRKMVTVIQGLVLDGLIAICEYTMELPMMETDVDIYQMQLQTIKEQYYSVLEAHEKAPKPVQPLMEGNIIDIQAEAAEEATGLSAATPTPATQLLTIPVAMIDANPFQPRKTFSDESIAELAKSIQENGLLQPPVVRLVGDRYQLIAGERRTRAIRTLGWTDMAVNVVTKTDTEVAAAALVENFQREDVSALETAQAIDRLVQNLGMTQGEVANRMGVTQAKVSQWLSLLKLIRPFRQMLENGEISSSIARTIATLSEEGQKSFKPKEIAEATVKNVQLWVNRYKTVETMVDGAGLEIHAEDPLRLKFVKYMRSKDLIDIYETFNYSQNSISHDAEIKNDFTRFYLNWSALDWDTYSKIRDRWDFLEGAVNKDPYMSTTSGGRVVLKLRKTKQVTQEITAFMDAYCSYEPPKNAVKGKSEEETKKKESPPTPKMTKEERQEKMESAQAASPVEVLSVSTPSGKGDRLLQRMQEHQGQPMHDFGNRCYNCKSYIPEGKSYRERCKMEYWNTNNLDRFHVQKQPDLFLCDKYEPNEEQIKKDTIDGMDHEAVMLELLLSTMGTRSITDRYLPGTKGKSIPQLIKHFKELDNAARAYFLHVVSLRLGIYDTHGGNKYFIRPDGTRTELKPGIINGASDI